MSGSRRTIERLIPVIQAKVIVAQPRVSSGSGEKVFGF